MRFLMVAISMIPLTACAQAQAPTTGGATAKVVLVSADEDATEAGTVVFRDSDWGVLIEPKLHGLSAGPHGAHVHVNPSCDAINHQDHVMPAAAAGDHYDPGKAGVHAGPFGAGHLGDLPNLIVEADGTATIPLLAPRLKVADLRERALIIHAEADRYAEHDTHSHNHGAGGARMYCGVIR